MAIYLGEWTLMNYPEPSLGKQGFNSPRLQAPLAAKWRTKPVAAQPQAKLDICRLYNRDVVSCAPARQLPK